MSRNKLFLTYIRNYNANWENRSNYIRVWLDTALLPKGNKMWLLLGKRNCDAVSKVFWAPEFRREQLQHEQKRALGSSVKIQLFARKAMMIT